jgi:NAD(P)-dependent dehydrogenase (short-subunit alcohol dehydrogenase family)
VHKLSEKYRTALVTGGSSGLGLAFCEMLASEGVKTFSASRHPAKLPDLSGLQGLELDLSNLLSVNAFAKHFAKEHGVPDLLINNAGYGAVFEWDRFPEEEIARQLDVMLEAPALLCRAFAPAMAERGSGGIVNVSSLAVQYPLPFLPMYNAAKAGLSAFSASLALEYQQAPFVIDFRPGDFSTSFNDTANCREDEASEGAAKVWRGMKERLQNAPDPVRAARRLRSSLAREKSGIVYTGGFVQARLAPLFQRLLPSRSLLRFVRIYHGKGRDS